MRYAERGGADKWTKVGAVPAIFGGLADAAEGKR